jgi:4-amino-4-deoxy-L-arabinose transferase-like glycosyltransferase
LIDHRFSKIYPQKWAQIIILLGFCFALYFINLGQWDLWNPDEPRYAQVAREMVNRGDWILMHFNGKIYGDKPPLFFWLISLSSYLWQGFTSYSARFPSALFGTFTVLLTFLLGKELYASRTGFLSGFILTTTLEFAYLSTRANIDTTLTFFTTASLFCFIQWYRHNPAHLGCESKRPSPLPNGERAPRITKRNINNRAIYGFYIAMALATLTKGPVGLILPLLTSLAYLLIQKDWRGIKEMRLLPGMVLFIAIVLAWYLPAIWKGGQDYLNETLFHQTIDRYSKGWSHVHPIYYYLYKFPIDFLPWIFFLPAAMIYGFSKEVIVKKKDFLFLLTWFIVILLFFSISKGKRGLYLLPLFPAASLMVGKFWNDFISDSIDHFRSEWISFPLYGLMGLTLIAGAAIPWVVSMKFPFYLPYSLPVAFLMIGAGLALFVLFRFKNYGAILFLIVGVMAGGFFYTLRIVFPMVNPYKSARFICQEIMSRIQPGERLGIYSDLGTGPYNFYTGIVPILELEREEDLFGFLQSSERIFCLLKFRDFSRLETEEGRPKVQLIDRRNVGDDDIVLVSNR